MTSEISTRQRILDAALRIAKKHGIKVLTQPRVAKEAGVRQSHLTYYFPRKADLLAAVLEASHQHGRSTRPKNPDEAMRFLEALFFEPNSMRFFLGAIIEAADQEDLRKALAGHVVAMDAEMALIFGRSVDDPAVSAFVDELRGLGVRLLLEPKRRSRPKIDIRKLAEKHGLA